MGRNLRLVRDGVMHCAGVVFSFLMLASAASLSAAERIDFSREILPILSDKCFHCHGPDEESRAAELRLDTKDGLYRTRDNVAVVTPGKADLSELIRRILSNDPDEVMPPRNANRDLSPQQKDLLKRWVEEGAPWGVHWAFVAPGHPTPPGANHTWPRNEIDRFVLDRLTKEGLSPSAEVSKETWLRRVTFDLTGLPPTTAEIDAFLADSSPEAHDNVVTRLFQSPRYGERKATDWLDLARFADTHGYQMDRERPMWVYRDWVIRAFQRNQRFDEFVTWQLAGDLLPNATQEQKLATAFNRLHLQNEEGGIVEEEFRVAYVVDRVNTFGTAFLGLTLECARCHDHKYDPITQRDFYSLFSFFQNIDESGQTSYFTAAMPVPTVLLADAATDAKRTELLQKITVQEAALALLRKSPDTMTAFAQWLETRKQPTSIAGLVAKFDFDVLEKNSSPNIVESGKPAKGVDGPKLIPSPRGQAAELTGENGFTFPGVGHFNRTEPFTLALWIKPAQFTPRAVVLHHSRAPIDAGSRGYELLLENGHVAFGLHHMWPRNSLKVVTRTPVAENAWTHIAVTYDGSSRAAGTAIYLNGMRIETGTIRDGLFKDITYGGSEPDLALGHRFRDNGFKHGAADELCVFNRELTPLEVSTLVQQDPSNDIWTKSANELNESQRQALFELFFATDFVAAREARAALQSLRKQENDLIAPVAEAMVMEEMPRPKPAFVLKRGNYDQPATEVTGNTPAALPAFPQEAPRNRLGLTQWLLHPDHPLMARVTVNRYWQQCFGTGLVETSDNFGTTGATPTHPELLDWLARDFVEHGWDVHRLLRQMVLSSTYRQSSNASPTLRSRDPANQLLARMSPRRLTAEMLRDQALFVSGLLVEKVGGPSVKPYQPPGLWEEKAMGRPTYNQGKGDDLYRRSLYTYWKRTVPHPAMTTFDAAERNVCTVRRQSTSTPLQAFVLLNDEQHVEAARFLAERMLQHGGDTDANRVAWAFRETTGRQPTPREVKLLTELLSEQRALFQRDGDAAQQLLKVGQKPASANLSPVDLAAATVVAQALLNLDEVVYRR
jgi:hypothetical protein